MKNLRSKAAMVLAVSCCVTLPAQAAWLETFSSPGLDNTYLVAGQPFPHEGGVFLTATGGIGFLESDTPPSGSNGNIALAPNGPFVVSALNPSESFTDVVVTSQVNLADVNNNDPQRVDHSLLARTGPTGGYLLGLDVESTLESLTIVKVDFLANTAVELARTPLRGLNLNGEDPYFLAFTLIGDMLTGQLFSSVANAQGGLLAQVAATDNMFATGFSGFGAAPDSTLGLTSPIRAGFDNVSSAVALSVPLPGSLLLIAFGCLIGRRMGKEPAT